MATINFTIEEAADAKSFTFKLVSTDVDPGTVADAVLSVRFQDNTEYFYQLPTSSGFLTVWEDGIEIFTYDIEYPKIYFEDGIFDCKVTLTLNDTTEVESESVIMGFIANIVSQVMKDALTYHPSKASTYRESITERVRLMNNLRYATETGSLQFFQDNLIQLKKMQ